MGRNLLFVLAFIALCGLGQSLTCNKDNEESKCIFRCPSPKTCANRFVGDACAADPTEVCKDQCVCKEGYFRDSRGECVTNEQCGQSLTCNKDNEESQCILRCPSPKTCANRFVAESCAADPTEVCKDQCVCKEGYFRDSSGECVTNEQCGQSLTCNKDNEESQCILRCPSPKTCANRFVAESCAADPTEVCKDQCVCKEGYYRSSCGECVTNEQCGN